MITLHCQYAIMDQILHEQLWSIMVVTNTVLSDYPHTRFRTHTALGSPGIISDNQDLFPNPPGEAKR